MITLLSGITSGWSGVAFWQNFVYEVVHRSRNQAKFPAFLHSVHQFDEHDLIKDLTLPLWFMTFRWL